MSLSAKETSGPEQSRVHCINVDGAEAWASAVHTSGVREGLGTLLTLQSTLAQLAWS